MNLAVQNNQQEATLQNARPSLVSRLVSRNIVVNGRRTSMRMEPTIWNALKEMCERENCTIHEMSTRIYRQKPYETSLTSAIRVYVLNYYYEAATEEGHTKSGHGILKAVNF